EEGGRVGAGWSGVRRAGGGARGSGDGLNLRRLVDQVLPRVEAELASSSKTLLLTRAGLLARYDRMQLLEHMRDRVGRPGALGEGLFGAWLVVACDSQAPAPMLDGKPIPVVTPGEWARVPEAWVANRHRGGGGEGTVR